MKLSHNAYIHYISAKIDNQINWHMHSWINGLELSKILPNVCIFVL